MISMTSWVDLAMPICPSVYLYINLILLKVFTLKKFLTFRNYLSDSCMTTCLFVKGILASMKPKFMNIRPNSVDLEKANKFRVTTSTVKV